MGSRALLLLRGVSPPPAATHHRLLHGFSKLSSFEAATQSGRKWARSYSVKSSLEGPDLARLAQTARISLTPTEVEEFSPKIQQVVDWFGQLQSVDLESIDPAIRAGGSDLGSFRDDIPEAFENREAMLAAVPSYDKPYIKVPKVLNKE